MHSPPVYRIVLIQAVMAVLLAVLGSVHSLEAARSLFVGALICTISHAIALGWYFGLAQRGGTSADWRPRTILKAAYWGEALKFLATIVLFGITFSVTRAWQPVLLFAGYLIAQVVYWAAPLLLGRY